MTLKSFFLINIEIIEIIYIIIKYPYFIALNNL